MDARQRELASGLLFVFDPADPEHAQAAADFLKTALDALDIEWAGLAGTAVRERDNARDEVAGLRTTLSTIVAYCRSELAHADPCCCRPHLIEVAKLAADRPAP